MSAVGSLSRIVLICRDRERLSEFYARAFGFMPLAGAAKADPDFVELIGVANGCAWTKTLRLGDQLLTLAQIDPPARPYPDDVSVYDPIFQHFAIVVSDMASALSALDAVPGWAAISTAGPQILPVSSGGVTAFKLHDPEGHPLELLAFPSDAVPAVWARQSGGTFLGIDHSAISVTDTARSVAFYQGFGLTRVGGSLNIGAEQDRLDGIDNAIVEVTALAAAHPVPHVELLCYRGQFRCRDIPADVRAVAATQLVFAAAAEDFDALVRRNWPAVIQAPIPPETRDARILLRDPDGHVLCLERDKIKNT